MLSDGIRFILGPWFVVCDKRQHRMDEGTLQHPGFKWAIRLPWISLGSWYYRSDYIHFQYSKPYVDYDNNGYVFEFFIRANPLSKKNRGKYEPKKNRFFIWQPF